MGRQPNNAHYITPIKSDGAEAAAAPGTDAALTGRGVFTLASGQTYYIVLGGQDAKILNAMMQGDAEIIVTSATIEETNLSESEASNIADAVSEWFATDDTRITSKAEGTGWSATNDVGASTGGNRGGVVWNIVDHGARRTRIKVVVGATGGQVRFAAWAKE